MHEVVSPKDASLGVFPDRAPLYIPFLSRSGVHPRIGQSLDKVSSRVCLSLPINTMGSSMYVIRRLTACLSRPVDPVKVEIYKPNEG